MLPYFSLISFSLGPIKIYIWGLLVAMGFFLSFLIARETAKKNNLKKEIIEELFFWIVVFSFFFARFFYVFLGGQGEVFLRQPWLFLAFWQGGFSSLGGFFGAFLILFFYFRRKKKIFWPYLEILAYTFPFGWLIGRFGCFLIHDHLGRLTNLFLAVKFPTGVRLDMGLMEILAILPLAILFLLFSRKKRDHGFFTIWLLLWYGIARFFLDFLRANDLPFSDPRYGGLTTAQWGTAAMIILGIILFFKKRKSRGFIGGVA